jgi:hypothetical protein
MVIRIARGMLRFAVRGILRKFLTLAGGGRQRRRCCPLDIFEK